MQCKGCAVVAAIDAMMKALVFDPQNDWAWSLSSRCRELAPPAPAAATTEEHAAAADDDDDDDVAEMLIDAAADAAVALGRAARNGVSPVEEFCTCTQRALIQSDIQIL